MSLSVVPIPAQHTTKPAPLQLCYSCIAAIIISVSCPVQASISICVFWDAFATHHVIPRLPSCPFFLPPPLLRYLSLTFVVQSAWNPDQSDKLQACRALSNLPHSTASPTFSPQPHASRSLPFLPPWLCSAEEHLLDRCSLCLPCASSPWPAAPSVAMSTAPRASGATDGYSSGSEGEDVFFDAVYGIPLVPSTLQSSTPLPS